MDVSVILTTYDRAVELDTTLQGFAALETEGLKWELIVVDNTSSDATRAVCRAHAGRLPLRYLFEPVQGKNQAVNTGIEHARGAVVVFCDDDITPDPHWLKEILAACARWPECQVFGGRVLPVFPANTPGYLARSDYSGYVYAIHDLAGGEQPYPDGYSPVGPNCWVRRRLLDEGWRFDAGIGPKGRGRVSGSELEFFTRLRNHGIGMVYAPSALVRHRVQPYQTTRGYLLKRAYASGRGVIRIFGFPATARLLFGAPRYLYRQLAEWALRATGNALALRFPASLECLMHAANYLGSIHEARASAGSRRSTGGRPSPRRVAS
jgi:glycosyltransferase involved in cell wall biosynthesis